LGATDADRERLILQARQHLEALVRAGLDRIPRAPAISKLAESFVPPAAHTTTPTVAPPRSAPTPPISPPRAPVPAALGSLFDDEPSVEPLVDVADRPSALAALAAEVAACEKCPLLAQTRTQTVFGEGNPTPRLMFVGEAPGETEDRTGRPFVGKAGQLLTDMITKGMGLAREDVYIANILKSRPPGNRDPLPDEIRHCLPFLERQIAILRPEFLCLLGKPAASTLLDTAISLGRLRGKWHRYRGIPTVVTWHPAYLLRNPSAKKDTWEDLQMLMRAMGITPPGRKSGGSG
jgi:DNA polymerase